MSGYIQRGLATISPPRCQPSDLIFERASLLTGRFPYWLLLLFILVIYTSPAILVRALAAAGPAQIVGGLALLALFFERARNRRGIHLVWPGSHLLVAFLWAAGLSCFDAAWPRLSVESTIDLAKFALIYLLIINTVDSERRLRGVALTMVLGGLVPTLGTLRNYIIGDIHQGERVHWVGIFANSNDLAYSLVLLVPLAAALAGDRGWWRRLTMWGIIAAYTATIYVTFSRGGILGLLAVLLIFGWRQRVLSIRILMIGLIVASIIFIGFFWSRDQGFTDISDFTLQQRLTTIRTGIAMFLDRPLLGVGLGGSVAAFHSYAPSNLRFTGSLVIHNTFIQTLSEVGIIGCILFTFFLVTAFLQARKVAAINARRGRIRTAALVDALEISLWGFVVCSLSGPYLLSWFPYILIGLVAAAQKMTGEDSSQPTERAEERGAES